MLHAVLTWGCLLVFAGRLHPAQSLSITLYGGRVSSEGLLRVYRPSYGWGTVCDTGFGHEDATAICRMRGYTFGMVNRRVAPQGRSYYNIWLTNVNCPADITDFNQCSYTGWANTGCSHSSDVRIKCGYLNPCSSSTCLNGGTCQAQGSGLTKRYRCFCSSGYTGTHCENNIDDCRENPCGNNGICIDEISGYRCQCFPGWTGANCETLDDGCVGAQCANDSTCVPLSDKDYSCQCPPGIRGNLCDEADPCVACSNKTLHCDISEQSTNQTENTTFTCVCEPGFRGLFCESVDPCVACSNNTLHCDIHEQSTNQTENTTFTCVCQPGFEGLFCESDVNDCANIGCENGGTCLDGTESFTCLCVDGFSGERCQIDIDNCASTPCQSGGTCVDEVNGYSCKCLDGFTGRQCEQEIDECQSAPCANGGICMDGKNWYICQCLPQFTGLNCERDACYGYLCLHGSKCVMTESGPTCECSEGFSGQHCEDAIHMQQKASATGGVASGGLTLGVVTLCLLLVGCILLVVWYMRSRKASHAVDKDPIPLM